MIGGIREDIDPAFTFASNQNDFFARLWLGQLSKVECKKRMDEWNGAVDKYIASGKDLRPKIDIELAAKIGMNGGPLYKRCEAESCDRVEVRDVEKMKCCGSCKLVYYCSQACQVSDWKRHKIECKSKSHAEQQLPSQTAFEETFLDMSRLRNDFGPPLEQADLD